ncbi:MAG: hypothetical protein H6742_10850 [Alphaproteobacteria bacterium]|nr:hypothetical protein [Alphaproteobacteria bacterium]
MNPALLLLIPALLTACGESDVAPPPPAAAPAPPPEAPAPPPPSAAVQEGRVLAPSPLELRQAVVDAGLSADLSALVPAQRFEKPADGVEVVAIRTGVRTADAVLVGEKADKAAFVARLKEIRGGMAEVGLGEGLLSLFDDVIVKVENDAASREDFVAELDQVVSSMVPEDGWGPDDKTGPLVQAGAWLGGTDLVAQAVIASGNDAAADKLLRRPEVPAYFLDYAKRQDNASGVAQAALVDALTTFRQVAEKPEPLTVKDAETVHAAAEKLFALL